jgi:hypothetical protein
MLRFNAGRNAGVYHCIARILGREPWDGRKRMRFQDFLLGGLAGKVAIVAIFGHITF